MIDAEKKQNILVISLVNGREGDLNLASLWKKEKETQIQLISRNIIKKIDNNFLIEILWKSQMFNDKERNCL